ncbi:MAG: hypothetical protein ABFS16_07330 [Bacteroidota bacterium]
MKKLGLLLIIAILGTTVAMAQNRGQRSFDPEEMAKRQTESLKEVLDLKKDQEKKVYELNLKAGKDMTKAREKAGGDREAMYEKMREIRDEQNKEMKKILSDSQWKKYEKYLEERRQRRGQGRPQR